MGISLESGRNLKHKRGFEELCMLKRSQLDESEALFLIGFTRQSLKHFASASLVDHDFSK
jgi:hypothetical protein